MLKFFFRYERTVEKTPKTIIVPRYEPVFVGTNLKEYETQVLQMSVPIDSDNDESFRKKKTRSSKFDFFPSFHLDNISYITKDRTSKKDIFVKVFGLVSKRRLLLQTTRCRQSTRRHFTLPGEEEGAVASPTTSRRYEKTPLTFIRW